MPVEHVKSMSDFCMRILLPVLVVSTLIVLGIFHCVFHNFDIPQNAEKPLLSSSAAFTLLAIVVALSAYLRNVANAADEKREKIKSGDMKLYELGKLHTEERLKALDATYDKMQVAARFLIRLTLLVTIRIFLDGIAHFGFYWLNSSWFFRMFDFLIFEWLLLAVIVLSLLHHRAYERDERIRSSIPGLVV